MPWMAKPRDDNTWAVISIEDGDRKDLAEKAHKAGFRVVRKPNGKRLGVSKEISGDMVEQYLKARQLNTGHTRPRQREIPEVEGPGPVDRFASGMDRSPTLEAAGAAADRFADVYMPIQDEARAHWSGQTPRQERAYGKKLQSKYPTAAKAGEIAGFSASVAAPAKLMGTQALAHGAAGAEGGAGDRAVAGLKSAALTKGIAGAIGVPFGVARRGVESSDTFASAVGRGRQLTDEAMQARAAADRVRQRAIRNKRELPTRERELEDSILSQRDQDLKQLVTPEQQAIYDRYVEEIITGAREAEGAAGKAMGAIDDPAGQRFFTSQKGPGGALILDPVKEAADPAADMVNKYRKSQSLGREASGADVFGGPRAMDAKAIREHSAKRLVDEKAAMRAAAGKEYDQAIIRSKELLENARLSEEGANRIKAALKDTIQPNGNLNKAAFARRMAELDQANRHKFLGSLADDLFEGAPGQGVGKVGRSAASVARGALMAAGKDKLAWQMFAFGASAGDAAFLAKTMRNNPAARARMKEIIESGNLDGVTTKRLDKIFNWVEKSMAKADPAVRRGAAGIVRGASSEQVESRRKKAEKKKDGP